MIHVVEKLGAKPIPLLISIVILILFIAPFFAGIVNLGNCFGTAAMTVLTLFFLFNGKATELLHRLWERPVGKVLLCTVSAFLIVTVIASAAITCLIVKAANDYPETSGTTMVVLGCKVKNGRPSLMLKRRLNAAYDYLAENGDVTVIVSGGQGSDESISEAQCMYEYLTEKGISPDRIIIEDTSKSTYENLRNSKNIISEKGLNEKITIVTDGYHQLRAEMIADKLGIEAYNISAPTAYWLIPTYLVREWFGVAYQFVFG